MFAHLHRWPIGNRIGLTIGLVVTVLGMLGMLIAPENAPRPFQVFWNVPNGIQTHGAGGESNNPGYRAGIWVGRLRRGRAAVDSDLQYAHPALRSEASLADARVDARAQYRSNLAALAVLGLLIIVFSLPWHEGVSEEARKVLAASLTDARIYSQVSQWVNANPLEVGVIMTNFAPPVPVKPVTLESIDVEMDVKLTDGSSSRFGGTIRRV